MSERSGLRPPLPGSARPSTAGRLVAGLTVVLLLAGCTAAGAGDDGAAAVVTHTVTAGTAADDTAADDTAADGAGPAAEVELPTPPTGAAGGITVVAPPAADDGAGDPATTGSGPAASASTDPAAASQSRPSATKTTAPAKPVAPKVKIAVSPGQGATKVSPLQKITVSSRGGLLENVKVINPEGKTVYHGYKIHRNNWSVDPELGFDRKYRVVVDSKKSDGQLQRDEAVFTTLPAKARLTASIFPSNNKRVGVGQPVQITFSEPIRGAAAKAAVEKMITVKTQFHQIGKFRWFSDTEVRWRPKNYFAPNSSVQVTVKIYGKQISGGLYGGQDASSRFVVSRSMISTVDAATHEMAVRVNGKVVKQIPVSLGNDKYPTYNGVHVVTERLPTHLMDSSTWGLTGAGAYRTRVKWATRISNTGEFVHGAPWSVYAQGNSNVSHGCINMTDAAAKWFMTSSLPGDVVIVKNSKGSTLQSWDGYGDWNLSWAKY